MPALGRAQTTIAGHRAGSNLDALRARMASFCRRTLRNQVTEYVRNTERRDLLIDELEQRLAQRTETEPLFTIRWSVV